MKARGEGVSVNIKGKNDVLKGRVSEGSFGGGREKERKNKYQKISKNANKPYIYIY